MESKEKKTKSLSKQVLDNGQSIREGSPLTSPVDCHLPFQNQVTVSLCKSKIPGNN